MNTAFELEVFFDSACPLCKSEVSMIRRLDKKNKILFTDIADPQFDMTNYGKTLDQLMKEMHARLSDGSWITGVEVFRRMYAAVGFRWVVSATRLPGISQGLNVLYNLFARNRLKLTGRCHGKNRSCNLPQ